MGAFQAIGVGIAFWLVLELVPVLRTQLLRRREDQAGRGAYHTYLPPSWSPSAARRLRDYLLERRPPSEAE